MDIISNSKMNLVGLYSKALHVSSWKHLGASVLLANKDFKA